MSTIGNDKVLRCGKRELAYGSQTVIMGILNVTPDSFSDGGEYIDTDVAVAHGMEMFQNGAKIIDVGGESTRPGYKCVSNSEECKRVIPVIKKLRGLLPEHVLISIDTTKEEVATAALEAGADIINDISGNLKSPLISVAADHNAGYVFTHNYETDKYDDVAAFFNQAKAAAAKTGLLQESIVLDPGIGFGKEQELNEEIIRRADELVQAAGEVPVMMAASRKRVVGNILGTPPDKRFEGDIAVSVMSAMKGCSFLRVHDVLGMAKALKVVDTILNSGQH